MPALLAGVFAAGRFIGAGVAAAFVAAFCGVAEGAAGFAGATPGFASTGAAGVVLEGAGWELGSVASSSRAPAAQPLARAPTRSAGVKSRAQKNGIKFERCMGSFLKVSSRFAEGCFSAAWIIEVDSDLRVPQRRSADAHR